ncbi:hypothetical protein ABTC40_19525, partial [Acinetobacter baumannii]
IFFLMTARRRVLFNAPYLTTDPRLSVACAASLFRFAISLPLFFHRFIMFLPIYCNIFVMQ